MTTSRERPAPGARPSNSSGMCGGARVGLTVALLVVIAGAGFLLASPKARGLFQKEKPQDLETAIARMMDSELLILEVNPTLKKLSKSISNLQFPDTRSAGYFTERVRVIDLAPTAPVSFAHQAPGLAVGERSWPVERKAREVDASTLRMWQPLMAEVDYFDRAKFFFRYAKYLDEAQTEWETEIGFKGLAHLTSGKLASVDAEQTLVWQKVS